MTLETWMIRLIDIAVIIAIAAVLHYVLSRLIRRVVRRAVRREEERNQSLAPRAAQVMETENQLSASRQTQRAETLGTVLTSVLNVTMIVVVVLMVLAELNINVTPALASAGIGGIAIGFGAQTLIKDVISGTFLVLEDQFGVGDLIKVGDLEGTVQAVGFRTTRLQDASGSIWYIRNGEIVTLGNRTQGWSTGTITIPVATDSDPLTVLQVLKDVSAGLENEEEWRSQMLEPPTVLGLSAVNATSLEFMVVVKSPANKQWGVERELRARAIRALHEAGIRSPDPAWRQQ